MFGLVTINDKDRQISKIEKEVTQISEDARSLGNALQTLDTVSGLIDNTIEKMHSTNYEKPKAYVNELKLEDEYKQDLINEIDNAKKNAIDTLEPLRESSEKLRGHMVVSMIKAKNMTSILKAQKHVIQSGIKQTETIKRLCKAGGCNSDEIKKLVQECEQINKVTKGAVLDFNEAGSTLNKTIDDLADSGDEAVTANDGLMSDLEL